MATATTEARAAANGDTTDPHQQLSIAERYAQAVVLTESSPKSAVQMLEKLQHEVARVNLFSSNESLEDISTKSLPLLALEHYLALAYTRLPSAPGQIRGRQSNLLKSMDLWSCFLQKLEALGDNDSSSDSNDALVSPAERKEYEMLLECSSSASNGNSDGGTAPVLPAPRREDKIARFRAKQQAQQEVARLSSLRERRTRVGISSEEVMDDMDEEGLDRTVAMTNLLLNKAEALEEWASTIRELPMIERMAKMEAERSHMERHKAGSTHDDNSNSQDDLRQRPRAPDKGLQVTHITLDANSQLQFRKEEIKSQVFRAGWNQPTMSLEQLADREVKDAMEREERQKQGEANRALQPRRYDQLLKDGMEDHADAVDASAALDQAWDDWKDENPRGSGNKHGDRGDRNF